jgi:hypothetical protein
MTTLQDITQLTKNLRDCRDVLSRRVAALNEQINILQARLLPGIRTAVDAAASEHSLLDAAIDNNRSLFDSPKSIVVHGYRVGLRKGQGGIVIEDPDRTIALIKKHLEPGQADLLIETKEKLDLSALNDLPASDLKKIGCQIEATGDVVYIKPTDTAVDKIVKALLKSATDSAVEKQEAA